MGNNKFQKVLNSMKEFYSRAKAKMQKGYKWIGTDGLLTMETAAILVGVFMVFLPVFYAMIGGLVIAVAKCALDKSRGSENEKHDLVCAVVGVAGGAILGASHALLLLF